MPKSKKWSAVAAIGAATLALVLEAGPAAAAKPNTMESCKICHQAADGVLRGKMVSVSGEFKSMNVTIGPVVWIVKYGDDLKVKEGEKISGADALKTITRDREIAVSFTGGEKAPVAVQVAVKQPFKLAAEKIIAVEQMLELAAQGPDTGKFAFFDSRPGPMFAEGHIPGAVSLPYASFKEKAAALLPADKGALLIFYCAGET